VDFWDDATDAAPGDGCEMVNKWLFDGDDDGMFAADADAAAYNERLVETKQQPPLAHRGTQRSKNVVTKEKAFRPKARKGVKKKAKLSARRRRTKNGSFSNNSQPTTTGYG